MKCLLAPHTQERDPFMLVYMDVIMLFFVEAFAAVFTFESIYPRVQRLVLPKARSGLELFATQFANKYSIRCPRYLYAFLALEYQKQYFISTHECQKHEIG